MPRLRLSAPRAAVLLSLLVGGAACSSILGIQDRSLEKGGGDGGDDGSSSDATTDTGPTGDSGNHTDASDSGAASDTSTPPGDAGVDAPTCSTPCLLASKLDEPLFIASDATRVYWTESGTTGATGNVKSCPLGGCGAGPTVYAIGQVSPWGITSDGTNVYWVTSAPLGSGGGVWTCPVAGCNGGAPTKVTDADNPVSIVVDATYAYWVDYYNMTVYRVAKAGGATTVLWNGSDAGLINHFAYVAMDDASVYAIDDQSTVVSVPLGGGSFFPINNAYSNASSQFGDWTVTLDQSSVYFGSSYFSAILELPKKGMTFDDGGPMLATGLQQPWGVTRDPSTGEFYYLDEGTGTGKDGVVGKIPAAGGTPLPMATSLLNAVALTQAGPYVFWLSEGSTDSMGNIVTKTGSLYRIPK